MTAIPSPDDYRDDSIRRLAEQTSPDVSGMLLWTDPSGGWWMAPLGSPAPNVDRPMPIQWVPIVRRRTPEREGKS
jgi:hypothetical protein